MDRAWAGLESSQRAKRRGGGCEISAHVEACIREVRHVQHYLKSRQDVGG